MNKTKIQLLLACISLFFLAGFFMIKVAAETTLLQLQITPGLLYIAASGNTIAITRNTQLAVTGYVTGTLPTNALWLEDLAGSASGYYTTIQISNLTSTGGAISKNNIYFKTLATPTVIGGSANTGVQFGSGIRSIFGSIGTPQTYFYRKANEGVGPLGRYGDTPEIQVVVPPNQATGTYRGILSYILYK